MTDLANLNKLLPRGIKATEVNGQIRYTVRTSINGKRASLGTFIDQAAAVKALYEFKIKGSYTAVAESIADEVTNIVATKQIKLDGRVKEEENKTPLAEDVDLLRNYIDMNGPHLLGSGNEAIHITLEDGTIKYISAQVVAIIYQEIWGMAPSDTIAQIVEL